MEVLYATFSAIVYTMFILFRWLKNARSDANITLYNQNTEDVHVRISYRVICAICARNFKGPRPLLMRFGQDLC